MDIATDFFSWLIPQIDRIWDDAEFQEEVSAKLQLIHEDLHWEVGPDVNKPQFFAISPNCDPKLLSISVALVSAAPEHPNWAFYAARPRKLWESRQIEALIDGDRIRVVFDDWTYTLTAQGDGEALEISLYTAGDEDLPDDALQSLAELFVLFELGEIAFIELVDRINIERSQVQQIPVENLWEELQELQKR